ncbi:unnamed protein product [Sphagnum balticum]
MSKVAVGSIPKEVCYVSSEQQEVSVGCAWDIGSWYDEDDENNTAVGKEKVFPTFPIENGDEKSLKRAKEWAEAGTYGKAKKSFSSTVLENKPIKKVRLLSLEESGNGGRAYKALIDNKYYVDMREDVLMDTLLKTGVDAGGILRGEYVWAKMGSQMRLVRVDSELHKLITEFESKKDIKPVGKNDLEVGGVYQDRKKNQAIFVGYVNTCTFKPETAEPNYYDKEKKVCDFKYKKTFIKKGLLFFKVPFHEKKVAAWTKKMFNKDESYWFEIKKSHTYIEKVDQIELPKNMVERLREKALKEIKDDIMEYTGHKVPEKNVPRHNSWSLSSNLCYNSDHINLTRFEDPIPEPFDIKKFLLFS